MVVEGQEKVVLSSASDAIGEIRITRPKALNALNSQVLDELEEAVDALAVRRDIACLTITGDGDRAFVAGADIAEMSELSAEGAHAFSRKGHDLFDKIEDFPVPVIAAVNGFALGGGCELALACDMIVASENAKFGQPEVKLGLIPGFGGTVRLTRKVGLAAATEWIMTGDVVSAQQAQALGLVYQVVAPEDLISHVRTMGAKIASRGPLAIRAAKAAMVQGLRVTPREAARLEQEAFAGLFTSSDMREGTLAFLQKRKPSFKGC